VQTRGLFRAADCLATDSDTWTDLVVKVTAYGHVNAQPRVARDDHGTEDKGTLLPYCVQS
jgi:hypothetical protein